MKKILLLLLFLCNPLYSQSPLYLQSSENQIDYFKSHLSSLKEENGNSILDNPIEPDSLLMTGEAANDFFGYSVSTAGDVNGDGYSDVIVGAWAFDSYSGRGRVYIFYGGVSMNNVADITITGEVENIRFGYSVSTAGDVNGDGYSDVIVGAYNYSSGIGKAYIFYGGSSMNNIEDVTLTGATVGENNFGYSVCTAGDVNGDSYDDVIVGAYTNNNGTGKAYIFYGGSLMNNVADVTMTGEAEINWFGISVSTAGDVNGDSYDDVIVGAHGYSSNIGRAYIFYGGSSMNNVADVTMTGEAVNNWFGYSVSTAGDINGDSYHDVIVGASGYSSETGKAYIFYGGSSMNNVADATMTGEAGGDSFGYSVCTAGDVNRDSYDDVIVGAFYFESIKGRAYIYYGGAIMNNTADIIMTGETTDNRFGHSVSTAGDVNGDGKPDIIVGGHSYSSYTGRAYLYINVIQKPMLINPINNSINNPLTINFKWKKLNTAIYYILFVSPDSAFNNITVNDTISVDTSKTVNGLQKGTKYFWRVKAIDTSGVMNNSAVWNFTTIPPIKITLKALMEGMYSPTFNQLTRKDIIKVHLRNSSPPYELADYAEGTIDSLSFSGLFNFNNSLSGTYFLVVKHFNCIETWSKSGGESLIPDGSIYNYDFTASNTQAYGNNSKLKGSKYCLYSGDINQDGYITLFDVIPIYNDASNFITGNYLTTDLTGDGMVDLTDVTLCYNNSTSFIRIKRP